MSYCKAIQMLTVYCPSASLSCQFNLQALSLPSPVYWTLQKYQSCLSFSTFCHTMITKVLWHSYSALFSHYYLEVVFVLITTDSFYYDFADLETTFVTRSSLKYSSSSDRVEKASIPQLLGLVTDSQKCRFGLWLGLLKRNHDAAATTRFPNGPKLERDFL